MRCCVSLVWRPHRSSYCGVFGAGKTCSAAVLLAGLLVLNGISGWWYWPRRMWLRMQLLNILWHLRFLDSIQVKWGDWLAIMKGVAKAQEPFLMFLLRTATIFYGRKACLWAAEKAISRNVDKRIARLQSGWRGWILCLRMRVNIAATWKKLPRLPGHHLPVWKYGLVTIIQKTREASHSTSSPMDWLEWCKDAWIVPLGLSLATCSVGKWRNVGFLPCDRAGMGRALTGWGSDGEAVPVCHKSHIRQLLECATLPRASWTNGDWLEIWQICDRKRTPFLLVFWDVPRSSMHAVGDIGAVVEWLSATNNFQPDAKSSLAILHNRNKMVNLFRASNWVTNSMDSVVSRGVTTCAGMTAHTVIVAQTRVGFLTGGRKQSFRDLVQEEQSVQLEEAFDRATVAITRARSLCLIMEPLDMKGVLGAATVVGSLMYGAGQVWAGLAHFHLHDRSVQGPPTDAQFIQMLSANCCLNGPDFPPPCRVEVLKDYVQHIYKVRRLHLIVVHLWRPWRYNAKSAKQITDQLWCL